VARLALWLACGWLGLSAAGCFTMGHTQAGNPIAWEGVEALEVGTHTVADALELLGAPLEYHRHPDGTLYVWRHREYDYLRLGIEPDLALTFTSVDRLASSVLENIRVVVESGKEFENRVVTYFDRDGVLAAVGTHRGGAE